MKLFKCIIVLFSVLLIGSCGPKRIIPEFHLGEDPGDKIFEKAETKFYEKSYDEALDLFNDYLILYPEKRLAPAALLKIGAINISKGHYEDARNVYKRLETDYPESIFVQHSKVGILSTYYNEGNYEKVISHADDIDDDKVAGDIIIRKYAVLSDAYIAVGSPADAVKSYITAYDKIGKQDKIRVMEILEIKLSLLSSEDIKTVADKAEDTVLKPVIMFQLGVKQGEENKYGEGIVTFTQFVEMFPDHEKVREAEFFMEDYAVRSEFDRNTVGCLLPLSGRYKTFGNKALKGIELALTQFYSLGINTELEIKIKDTEADPEKAVAAVQELAEEGVAAIIGPMVTAEAVVQEAQSLGMPIIAVSQKDQIAEAGDYVFRNFLTPEMQVKTIVSYAVEELGLSRFAILYPEEKYGETFMNLFWDEVISYGGEIVGVESYTFDQTDFATAIRKLTGLYYEVPADLKETVSTTIPYSGKQEDTEDMAPIIDFEAIFIPDGPKKVGLIAPQLVFFDVNEVYLFGTNLWHSDQLIEMARQHVNGAIIPEIFFAESTAEEVVSFTRFFEETYGETPGAIEAVAYDIATMLFQILSMPDVSYRSSIKEKLMHISDFKGVTGTSAFNDEGDAIKELYLLKIKGNKFVELVRNR
ncbi:MAG: penicillin-binding protein activator [Desulfobacterales bacterium]|nr:penicillin-binding protein activator [Desulfobacterales bacterium]